MTLPTLPKPFFLLPPDDARVEALTASAHYDPFPLPDNDDWYSRALMASAVVNYGDTLPFITAAAITAGEGDTGYVAYVVPEGIETSDRRFIEEGALTWRDGALPLMFIDRYTWGHDDAEFVGNLVNPRRVNLDGVDWIVFDVVWDDVEANDEAATAKRLVDEGRMFGVSADIVDVSVEIEILEEDEDGWPTDWLERYTEGVVAGATIVPIPAFEDAHIDADTPAAEDTEGETDDDADSEAAAADTRQHALAQLARLTGRTVDDLQALIAGAVIEMPDVVPAHVFADPEFDRPTGLTVVEEDGVVRIFGHAAEWGKCHIGLQDRCITAPHSATGYAEFLLGQVETDEGPMRVGTITMGTGHPTNARLTPEQTRAHYDNTGTAVAFVNVGEDDHGIWFSGVLRGTLTADDVQTLRASKLSGDWRKVDGNLELCALLAVNVPGFGVRAIEADHEQTGLVAAGMVDAAPCDTCEDAAADEPDTAAPSVLYFTIGEPVELPSGSWTMQVDPDAGQVTYTRADAADDSDSPFEPLELVSAGLADDPTFLRFALHIMETLDTLRGDVAAVRADLARPDAIVKAEAAAARIGRTAVDVKVERALTALGLNGH